MKDGGTCTITLTFDQCEFLKNAIGGYEYIISDVLPYGEFCNMKQEIIIPIYEQLAEEIF